MNRCAPMSTRRKRDMTELAGAGGCFTLPVASLGTRQQRASDSETPKDYAYLTVLADSRAHSIAAPAAARLRLSDGSSEHERRPTWRQRLRQRPPADHYVQSFPLRSRGASVAMSRLQLLLLPTLVVSATLINSANIDGKRLCSRLAYVIVTIQVYCTCTFMIAYAQVTALTSHICSVPLSTVSSICHHVLFSCFFSAFYLY